MILEIKKKQRMKNPIFHTELIYMDAQNTEKGKNSYSEWLIHSFLYTIEHIPWC